MRVFLRPGCDQSKVKYTKLQFTLSYLSYVFSCFFRLVKSSEIDPSSSQVYSAVVLWIGSAAGQKMLLLQSLNTSSHHLTSHVLQRSSKLLLIPWECFR